MIRMATIGAGRWGCMHASKVALHPEVTFTAIVDRQLTRAVEAAQMYGARGAFAHLDDALSEFDACIIALPIHLLAPVAERCLKAGKHVLVEKPGALSTREVTLLVDAQASASRIAAIGFLERFNVGNSVQTGSVRALALWRSAPLGPRFGGLGLDWCCHDIDLAHWLTGEQLTVEHIHTASKGVLRFRLSGQAASVRINTRTGSRRVRRLVWADGTRINLRTSGIDALSAQLNAFIGAINGGGYGRLAHLTDALRTLSTLETLTSVSDAGGIENGQYPLPM